MKNYKKLGYRSLKNLVYHYLREEIKKENLKSGDPINMEQTSKKLGISKTPLREALIKLETEGFVKIIPWSGVVVNHASLKDFKEGYQIIGALESSALLSASQRIKENDIRKMKKLNQEMREMIEAGNFDSYYNKNLKFHNVYLYLSQNDMLIDTVDILKKRLYEFARPKEFIKEWEDVSLAEHKQLIHYLEKGEFVNASNYLKDVIWSFDVQKKFIIKYYRFDQNYDSL